MLNSIQGNSFNVTRKRGNVIKLIRNKFTSNMLFARRLSNDFDPRVNSFHAFRLIFAMMVIYSHAYPLIKGNYAGELLADFSHNAVSFGSLAVNSFMIVSGFLITRSLLNAKSISNYFMNRIYRIFPGLLVNLIVISMIIIPITCRVDIMEYFFNDISNGPIKFILSNGLLGIFSEQATIHQVFSGNVHPGAVNGSLWTLRYEFALYLILPVFVYLRGKSKKSFFFAVVVLFVSFILYSRHGISEKPYVLCLGYSLKPFLELSYYFAAGALIFILRDKVPSHPVWLIIAFTAFLMGLNSGRGVETLLVLLPFIVIRCSCMKIFHGLSRIGDFSYGVYIYAFPIQQIICMLSSNSMSPLLHVVLASGITLIMAILSWFLVEKPFLSMKYK